MITYPQSRNKAVNTLIYSKTQNYIAKIYRFSKFIYIFVLRNLNQVINITYSTSEEITID